MGVVIFWCRISLPFNTVHGFLLARILEWIAISFSSDHILSELFTMTHLSWVALHGMAHSFIELYKAFCHNKAVVHKGESYDPAIPLLGIYLEKTIIQKDICTSVFTATLLTIVKTWKQSKCPLRDEWINKM